MTLEEWKEKNRNARSYAHFDSRVSLEKVWTYISNPENVSRHGFYPFIHYTKNVRKYKEGNMVIKSRELYYAAHRDHYIYSYYAYLLNEKYNELVEQEGLDNVAIAYRNNLGKNNIHFAKQAIDGMKEQAECFVIVSDFKSFFDTIDHEYLKQQLLSVLQTERLSKDWYAVFKHITKYSCWELNDILGYYHLQDCGKDRRELNQKRVLFKTEEFRQLKKQKPERTKKNNKHYGIPQGSSISAVLSNVYMLEVDKKLYELADALSGRYMRYCDDIILVLPQITASELKENWKQIENSLSMVPGLSLQEEKTQIYKYQNKSIENVSHLLFGTEKQERHSLTYLGFIFDGENVRIQDKTISRYYGRLYRKINTVKRCNGITKKGNRVSANNIYERYSIKGAFRKEHANFITYAKRADRIWKGEEPIQKPVKRHMLKIRRGLDQVNYSEGLYK